MRTNYLTRKESLASIGNRLGDISVSALSQNSRRISEKMRADEELQERIKNATSMFKQYIIVNSGGLTLHLHSFLAF